MIQGGIISTSVLSVDNPGKQGCACVCVYVYGCICINFPVYISTLFQPHSVNQHTTNTTTFRKPTHHKHNNTQTHKHTNNNTPPPPPPTHQHTTTTTPHLHTARRGLEQRSRLRHAPVARAARLHQEEGLGCAARPRFVPV
jgi:hypothetical protein